MPGSGYQTMTRRPEADGHRPEADRRRPGTGGHGEERTVIGQGADGQPRLRARISTTLPASFGARRSLAATSGTEMAAALGAALPLTEDMAR